ncbi:Hypp4487 [Branchiostoma lanceolatum]|uniref:Hypp4487 protein n=1 Tax=Branchiostoma lanceolatum TaxID=7740 RepID=A0A8K0F1T4_BRALA|nr:Hypp4487 [Branchiostoma lanceolatum]
MVFDKGDTRALAGWKSANDRIITARFQSRHGNATIVQVYEPTEDAEESDKVEFYNHLQDTSDSFPSHGVKIVMADSQPYQLKIQNRSQLLKEMGPDLEEQWKLFRETVTDSAEEIIGAKRNGARTLQDLEHLITRLEEVSGKVGLRMSSEKTKTTEVGNHTSQLELFN